ncbi:6044_t:CDS:2 [Dentiscutata erythropus]|uniref:6044_t:CDS:1 n=1 Tax=Dentiscutata erythropus TaxID=1348616 RepID=A0A9N8ZLJ5_9GLOM|nr:6044_t:CDS:2 [Dentiscutata erythropus]
MSEHVSFGHQWYNKLCSKDKQYPCPEEYQIIIQFDRDMLFYSPKYTGEFLFRKLYDDSKKPSRPSRPPNAFFIFRTVLGLVAKDMRISVGDGITFSRLAGFMWGGTNDEERNIYHSLSDEIKKLHDSKYPNYKYKPERGISVRYNFSNKTAKDYEQVQIQTHDSWINLNFLQQLNSNIPSIAVNCPQVVEYDPNMSQSVRPPEYPIIIRDPSSPSLHMLEGVHNIMTFTDLINLFTPIWV